MNELDLLIVEDDDSVIKSYESAIKRYLNKSGNELKINYEISKTKKEALKIMKSKIFQASIIDLRLNGSNPSNDDGNKVIEEILNTLRFPIYVVSASIDYLDEKFENYNLIKPITRGDIKTPEIIKLIAEDYKKTKQITKFFAKDGELEKYINNIFWNHLDKTLECWEEDSKNYENLDKYIFRYIISHLQEFLHINEDTGEFEKYHPAEIYIKPPIKKHLHSGDILNKKGTDEYYILLTPSCDMVIRNMQEYTQNSDKSPKRKAKKVLIAKLERVNELEDFKDFKTFSELSNKKQNGLKTKMLNNEDRYHFIPPFCDMNEYFIDFQDLYSIDFETSNIFERVATISSSFFKDIVARFSTYYSRQGQPDFDIDKILEKL